jgi:DNA-binding CsgD family transcriptional regulator
LLRFVGEAEDLACDDPFTPEVLAALGELVSADWVAYCEQDRVRQRLRLCVDRAGDCRHGEPLVSYWEIAAEHPVCAKHNCDDFDALMLSDFLTLRQLRQSRVYDVWFGPQGVERELNIALPSPPWHTRTFLFERGRGTRDFTERDRLVLQALQPHLRRQWRVAQTRRQLRAVLACLETAPEREARGVILLGAGHLVEFASPPAARLLREYFGTGLQLPAAVKEWLESRAPTLVRRKGNRRLTIDRSGGDALLLQESVDTLGLTQREAQILAWVARGKSNVEVAEMLWIAPSTVRKHLENVYAKLGVGTRTAAVARFLETLDAHDAVRSEESG